MTFEVADALGISRLQWGAACRDGVLDLLHRDVARMFGVKVTAEMRIQAGVFAAGPGAMASHRSAARLWGLERPDDDPVDVILPARSRRARLVGVQVHRPRDHVDLGAVWRLGIAATNPLRTLVDLGAVAPTAVGGALRRFIVDGFVSPTAVRTLLFRHARKGRSGITALRVALDAWALEDKPADSDLEEQMALIATHFGLPPMEFHARVGPYEVDFLVVGTNIVIECDGWLAHGVDRDQFEFDRARDADLLALGFITQRVTWRQMVGSPERAARRIEATLLRWAPEMYAAHRAGLRVPGASLSR